MGKVLYIQQIVWKDHTKMHLCFPGLMKPCSQFTEPLHFQWLNPNLDFFRLIVCYLRQAGFPLFLNNIISCSIGKFYSNFENLHNPQVERHSRRTCTHELVLPEQTCSLVYLSTCPMAWWSFCTWNKGSIWSFLSLVSMRPNPAIYNRKTLHKALNEMKRWLSV